MRISFRTLFSFPPLFCLLGLMSSVQAGIYNEENKSTLIYQLPGGWNMQTYERWWGSTLGPSVLPIGFNIDNIIETDVEIFSDPDPVSGLPSFASSFYRLNWGSGTGGAAYRGGGQYFLQCTYLPQCAVNLSRGPHDQAYFESGYYSSTIAPRVYLKLDYLNTGTTPRPQVVNDYYFPIGGWDMSTGDQKAQSFKSIDLPNLDIRKIVSASATIYSNPVNGKIEVDPFERRGYAIAVYNDQILKRGGVLDVVPNGTSSKVQMTVDYKIRSGVDNSSMYSDGRYTGTGSNRGWVKITYAGVATGVKQPYAFKSKIQSMGGWIIHGSTDNRELDLGFNTMGVPASRVTYAQATVHSDKFTNGTEKTVTNLMRNSYGQANQNSEDHGLFFIAEGATGTSIHMIATSNPGTYYYTNHSQGPPSNRGWFSMDYLAAQCNEGSGYTRTFFDPNPSSDNCHGNFGSGTSAVHVIQTKGNDIWGTSDQCAFIYNPTVKNSANDTIIARVDNQEATADWAKAGVMFRTGVLNGSTEASLLVTPTQGVQLTYRATANQSTDHPYATTGLKAPIWLRLIKSGNNYFGYTSSTGAANSWTSVGSSGSKVTVTTGNYYRGLASTSYSSELNTTVFSNVSF